MRVRHDTRRDRGCVPRTEIGEGVAVEYEAEPLDEMAASGSIGFRKHTRKLVAAIARHEVRRAQLPLQHRANLTEQAIARGLAVALVDVAQAIGEAEPAQLDAIGAERVGFEDIGAGARAMAGK